MSGGPPALFDVAVLGGGIAGAAAAVAAAQGDPRRGRPPARVVLLDQFEPGHERGSSHGDGRIVRFTYPEPQYMAMAKAAFPAWRALERRLDTTLLIGTGSWECGPRQSPRLAELEASLQRAELPFSRWSAAESRRHFPHFELPLGSEVLYQPGGAVVRAGAAVAGLWRLGAALGVDCRTHAKVEAFDLDVAPVRLATTRGEIRAERLIVCAGGWLGPLMARAGAPLPLVVTREVVAYFPVSSQTFAAIADHRAGAMPTFIDYHGDPEPPFYGLPQIDVPGIKVGWHHKGPVTEAGADEAADPELVRRLQRYVGDRLPYLDLHPVAVKTCLYTSTPDFHFVLDRLPGREHVVIGGGFSGHGFKFGPVLGEILADLAFGLEPAFDLELFGLARWRRPDPPARRQSA